MNEINEEIKENERWNWKKWKNEMMRAEQDFARLIQSLAFGTRIEEMILTHLIRMTIHPQFKTHKYLTN